MTSDINDIYHDQFNRMNIQSSQLGHRRDLDLFPTTLVQCVWPGWGAIISFVAQQGVPRASEVGLGSLVVSQNLLQIEYTAVI